MAARSLLCVAASYEAGSFLIDRLGAGLVIDRDLAVVLLDLRRRLIVTKVLASSPQRRLAIPRWNRKRISVCLARRRPAGSTWSTLTPKAAQAWGPSFRSISSRVLRAARLVGAYLGVVIALSGTRGSEGPCPRSSQ